MPHVSSLLPSVNDDTAQDYANPELIPLLLPSFLPSEILSLPDMRKLALQECRLRESQANDALMDIRRLRRIIQGLWHFKHINISGTGNRPNTRMLDSYEQINFKIRSATHRYRVAYNALLVLDPHGSWMKYLKELRNEDIRGPGRSPDDPLDNKVSKGRFEASWIWHVPCSSSEKTDNQTEEEFNESMRAEWAQARARMCRWKEEYMIVQEEMRRVLAFFDWKALWWLDQASQRHVSDPSLQSGLCAYAHKQAAICLRMATRNAFYWIPVLEKHGIHPEWAARYKLKISGNAKGEDVTTSDDDGNGDESCGEEIDGDEVLSNY